MFKDETKTRKSSHLRSCHSHCHPKRSPKAESYHSAGMECRALGSLYTAFSEHHSKQTLKEMGWGRQRQEDLCKCQDSLGQPRLYKKPCLKTKNKPKKKERKWAGALINRECAWIQASVTPRTRETGWKIGQCLGRFVLLQKLANSGKQIYFNFCS